MAPPVDNNIQVIFGRYLNASEGSKHTELDALNWSKKVKNGSKKVSCHEQRTFFLFRLIFLTG
jgi:hypothetical protein